MGQQDTADTVLTSTDDGPGRLVKSTSRRKASRPAGPATNEPVPATTAIATIAERPVTPKVRLTKPAGPPPRRQPNRARVAVIGLAVVAVLVAALVVAMVKLTADHRKADAAEARDQRFVDTASQMIMNMYSWTQDSLDKSVDQFVGNTSGPLRDKFTEGSNVDTLKSILRKTGNSSEAVINAAALESVDEISQNAEVLVAFRVTPTDMQGTLAPTLQQRVRITVHEDDNGHMTDYDLKWPEGGT
jgi:Mce-associated membrane protein